MKAPYVVIFTDQDTGHQMLEKHQTPESVNARLNELWGRWGPTGPERHVEARGVLGSRVNDFRSYSRGS